MVNDTRVQFYLSLLLTNALLLLWFRFRGRVLLSLLGTLLVAFGISLWTALDAIPRLVIVLCAGWFVFQFTLLTIHLLRLRWHPIPAMPDLRTLPMDYSLQSLARPLREELELLKFEFLSEQVTSFAGRVLYRCRLISSDRTSVAIITTVRRHDAHMYFWSVRGQDMIVTINSKGLTSLWTPQPWMQVFACRGTTSAKALLEEHQKHIEDADVVDDPHETAARLWKRDVEFALQQGYLEDHPSGDYRLTWRGVLSQIGVSRKLRP